MRRQSSDVDGSVGTLVHTEVTGMICGLRMRPLAYADLQNFQNLQTDVDNICSVFLWRIFLVTELKDIGKL